MANVLEAFGIKNASKLQFLNKRTKKYDLWLPWANSISLELSSDEVVANQQGERAIVWSSAKTGTLTISTQIVNISALSIMLGSSGLNVEDIDIFKRETFELKSADISALTVTLTETPKAGTLGVVKLLKDGSSIEKEFIVDTSGTTPATGHVILTGKVVKFNTSDFALGDVLGAMYFTAKEDVKTFTVTSVADSDSYEIYGDTMVKMLSDKSSKFMQLQVFDATVQQSATISFDSENASSFDIVLSLTGDTTRPDPTNGNATMFRLVPIE